MRAVLNCSEPIAGVGAVNFNLAALVSTSAENNAARFRGAPVFTDRKEKACSPGVM